MQTVRQAFTILKQNPLLSTISILGTAFAITMIMAIVITWQTKYADLEPEVNRSRCLYFSAMHVYDKEKDGNNNWSNYAMRMWLFTNNQNVGTSGEFSLNMEALFSPWVFLLAFVFCVVINLLSAALPAWIAARHTIVDSLNDK